MENTNYHELDLLEATNKERKHSLEENIRYTEFVTNSIKNAREEFDKRIAEIELLKESIKERNQIIQSKDEVLQAKDQRITELEEELELQKATNAKSNDPSYEIELADYHGAKKNLELVLYALANLTEPLLIRRKDKKRIPTCLLMDIISKAFRINLNSFQNEISHAMQTKSLEEHLAIFHSMEDVIEERHRKGME